ncbi:MAG: hypothetical protein KatS3mg019_2202 [Fimbriimonadales bacterium]|nr:MAG: hypothetical protein KatS3mg019_2202 [Fimbriimonadales bacterium]
MRDRDWVANLAMMLQTYIREHRGELLPFLETLATDADQRGSLDELYVINSMLITLFSKQGALDHVLEIKRRQTELKPLVSPEVVHAFGTDSSTLLAEQWLRLGQLEEAFAELSGLLTRVPLGSNECPDVVHLLAALRYAQGHYVESVRLWNLYIGLLELYTLLAANELISTDNFYQTNLYYSQGIRYLFETGEEEMKRQIADGCVRACRLVLGSYGQYVAISLRDIDFLQAVEQWLRTQSLIEEAEDVARCIELYHRRYQTYLQARFGQESASEED